MTGGSLGSTVLGLQVTARGNPPPGVHGSGGYNCGEKKKINRQHWVSPSSPLRAVTGMKAELRRPESHKEANSLMPPMQVCIDNSPAPPTTPSSVDADFR